MTRRHDSFQGKDLNHPHREDSTEKHSRRPLGNDRDDREMGIVGESHHGQGFDAVRKDGDTYS